MCCFSIHKKRGEKGQKTNDLLQVKLGGAVNVKCIPDILAEGQGVERQLEDSDCVVLVGSGQASFMIQNNRPEIDEDRNVLFDGRLIKKMFTAQHRKLVMVFFSKVENEWIPAPGFKQVFRFSDGEIRHKDPTFMQIEDFIRGILCGNNRL